MSKVLQQNLQLPAPDITEIYRYAGGKGQIDNQTAEMLQACLQESESQMIPRVCYRVVSVEQAQALDKDSKLLQTRLCGAEGVLVFAVTIGIGIDRLVRKYTELSPVKALYFQAIGAERIESACDCFCQGIANQLQAQGQTLSARFSPGYGDFSLQAQTQIHAMLACYKQIGVALNDSLLMSPSKSVTSLCAVGAHKENQKKGCENCALQNCAFRK